VRPLRQGLRTLEEHVADFVHELKIAASPDTVRKLLADRGDAWWTTNVLSPYPGAEAHSPA
jgi:hypothetical protein